MRKITAILILFISVITTAQSFEIAGGLGTGAFYFIEEVDNSVNTTYESPASLYFDLKYNFKDRIDGIKLRVQSTSVNIDGQDYQTGVALDGNVETFTTLLMYERLRSDKVFNIGYQMGMGLTQQEFIRQKNSNIQPLEEKFMSVTFGGLYSIRLHEKLRLNLETAIFWTDPINTFRGSKNWQTAGEDISFLAQLGVSYNFK
ncbi:hypothetical protein [Nonlabens antarcticus]|uniref:hypothetical protein n=1 Tax=Nonlabens antarcticus TaxID=392714 RepID=UPI0018910A89|nr:hypothetical protein [Nonlabens antarcticus]